ncbi:ER-to-golgi transport membrane protein [Crucibulum laeve]|uniref:ER-to-golgi transport membrane protein n=1 Tax=Crucibulum laeve TaxID=68775 RepID=A0A5C3ME88_9AGAR|nr:ER-to-golgi transport membrane protein [Crucibulum laeve]
MSSLFGTIFKVSLLFINGIAVLNEERFLARIGWTTSSQQLRDTNTGFHQPYNQDGYGATQGEVGIKSRMIDLISAVRTLMRIPLIAINILVILYELALG